MGVGPKTPLSSKWKRAFAKVRNSMMQAHKVLDAAKESCSAPWAQDRAPAACGNARSRDQVEVAVAQPQEEAEERPYGGTDTTGAFDPN